MRTHTAKRTWHHANDNKPDIPIEPPSTTPAAAPTILNMHTDNGVAPHKDAAPANKYGFTESGACFGTPTIMTHFPTWLFARDADPPICILANDL